MDEDRGVLIIDFTEVLSNVVILGRLNNGALVRSAIVTIKPADFETQETGRSKHERNKRFREQGSIDV